MFLADRSAAIIAIAVPVGIASFLTMVMGGSSGSQEFKPIGVVAVIEDDSAVTKTFLKKLDNDKHLRVEFKTKAEAEELARKGKTPLAFIIHKGFGDEALKALKHEAARPAVRTLTDPSQRLAVMASQGYIVKAIAGGIFDTASGESHDMSPSGAESTLPFTMEQEAQEKDTDQEVQASRAHIFAGMAVQGVLFYAINVAMSLIRDRRLGIWKRLRAAPVSITTILAGRVASGTIIGVATLFMIFLFGFLVMGLRINGSIAGFVTQCVACSVLAASFGLFVASIGKTEEQSRGLSVFVVLMLSMLGGAWFPSFLMPDWMQSVTLFVPSRWAVDGLDSALWRQGTLMEVLRFSGVTLLFAIAFAFLADRRIKATEAK